MPTRRTLRLQPLPLLQLDDDEHQEHDDDTVSPAAGPRDGHEELDLRRTAAALFLEALPAPWTPSRHQARALAPRLLAVATARGWRLDDELRAKLTEHPRGLTDPPAALWRRIDRLPRYGQEPPPPPRPRCRSCGRTGSLLHNSGELCVQCGLTPATPLASDPAAHVQRIRALLHSAHAHPAARPPQSA